jgi:murein DD-endopeptidase MepM/ murein hydrolase activator NlpD
MNILLGEIKCFPIPLGYDEDSYMFGDSWGTRSYGAQIIDRENVRGRIPVVSMTAGIVSDVGWKEKTGFQVIIKTSNDTYYSYSNLDVLSDGLAFGTAIQPGTPLGSMGVVGVASARLHLEISPQFSLVSRDFRINPFPFLRLVEGEQAEI